MCCMMLLVLLPRSLVQGATLGRGQFGKVVHVAWYLPTAPPGINDSENGTTTKMVAAEDFALKVVSRSVLTDPSQRRVKQCLYLERDLLFEVDHPFVVKLYNTFKSESHAYLQMEHVAGGSLRNLVKECHAAGVAVPIETVRFYAANIVLALRHLHEDCGIAHRDIKPHNILVSADGYLKIADFGFARKLGPGDRAESVVGTYAYLTPEQCMRRPYDRRVDVWSFAITVYYLIYGASPFEGPRVGKAQYKRATMENIVNNPLSFPVATRQAEDPRVSSECAYVLIQHSPPCST